MKSKLIAYFLWFVSIFGWLGFHRLYLGKVGTAILWLFTGGLLGWGCLYDLFALGSQVDVYNAQSQLSKIETKISSKAASVSVNVS